MSRRSTAPRLPDGTQVVLRQTAADLAGTRVQRGATGRVLDYHPADDDYLIQLTDGRRLRSPRGQLALRKAYQRNLAVEAGTALGEELLELRPAFLSQLTYQTYSGYVLSQFKKLEADLRQHGEPRWKHVMHLLRLLIAAGDLLRHGWLELEVGPHRERLLAVRRGELGWAEVERWRLALHADLDDAVTHTPLPAAPDTARVDAWLYSVRARSAREAVG